MNYTRKLVIYFVSNLLILFLANSFFPQYVVFGRLELGLMQAMLTTAFGITLAAMLVDLIIQDFNIKINAEKYIIVELFVNILALYVLARTPLQNSVGVGIIGFWVAIILGLFLSVGQFFAKKITDKKISNKK